MQIDRSRSTHHEESLGSSLLLKVKNRDELAWRRLWLLYGPVAHRWLVGWQVPLDDAMDLVQEVFVDVANGIARFERHSEGQSFRRWLWTLCRFKLLSYRKQAERLAGAAGGSTAHLKMLNVPDEPPQDDSIEMLTDTVAIVRKALALIREETAETTWLAFKRTTLQGEAAAHVAEDLGISVWAVYKARSRLLQKLRGSLGDPADLDACLPAPKE